jgi:RNA polymerase sigma factor (sigma-70 family)
MAGPGAELLRQIHRLWDLGTFAGLTDAQLLAQFAAGHEDGGELAFEALVERHGPMVFRVCRGVLRDEHAAEDAFQATFLVLARKARSLWVKDSLASWLHGVAHRVAARARADAARRRRHERRFAEARGPACDVMPDHPRSEAWAILSEEIARLPEAYRAPVVLCYLEAMSYQAAAASLGVTEDAVRGRLARARDRLRKSLVRRGVEIPAVVAAARPAIPAVVVRHGLVQATARAAAGLSASGVASLGAISRSVISLYERTCRTMMLTKLKVTAAALVLGVVAAGAIVSAQPPGGGRAGPSGPESQAPPPPKAVPAQGGHFSVDGIPADGRGGKKEITVDPNRHCIVNVYSTDEGVDQKFLYNFATVNILPKIKRTRGIASATILGNRIFAMRVWLNPDRMRAYNLSADDVMKALGEQSMIGSPGRLGQATGKTSQSKEYVLTYIGRDNKPEQYENIILKANPEGEILRLKDVAEVELGPSFYDIYSDIDDHPSAAVVLKQVPGSNAAAVIEEVEKKLEQIKRESFPPGMNFEVTPLLGVSKEKGMIYAVIQTPRGSTLEYTSAKCHELQAIAKGIEGITSVSSLAGYEVLTEGRGSNAGTCLIHLKNGSERKLTSHQIIEKLEEKGRQISNVKLEFFEPLAVPGSGAAGAVVSAQPPGGGRAEPSDSATKAPGPAKAGAARGGNFIVDWIPADGQGRKKEITVDPTRHCVHVPWVSQKRDDRPNDGAVRLDLGYGKYYKITAAGQAFMSDETGADADPFPGVAVVYPTDEEDGFAIRQIVLAPGKSVTFRSPWLIAPNSEVFLMAFFLDTYASNPKRGSYTLTIEETGEQAVTEHTVKAPFDGIIIKAPSGGTVTKWMKAANKRRSDTPKDSASPVRP